MYNRAFVVTANVHDVITHLGILYEYMYTLMTLESENYMSQWYSLASRRFISGDMYRLGSGSG